MPQSLAKNTVHLIFSTKERKPSLSEEIRPDLHAYMATIFKNLESPAIIINSMPDHIHILFLLHRTKTLSEVVGEVKRASSKWLKTQSTNLEYFSWQAGYGAFSVSESNIIAVKKYITNQQEHHQKTSFQEEVRAFLDKHGVEYDESYLWD